MKKMRDGGVAMRIRSLEEFDREFFPSSAGSLPVPTSSIPLRLGARFIREMHAQEQPAQEQRRKPS
jgi:hypothetical protein